MTPPEKLGSDGAALAIWRDTAPFEGLRTAALGAFECESAGAGADLLRQAMRRLKAEGFEAVVGPMDGDTWGRHRLVIGSSGRRPFLLEPHNPPHYPAAFEEAGLEIIARYCSAEGAVEDRPRLLARPSGLVIEPFDLSRAEPLLLEIHTLSLQAFAGNFLYRSLSAEDFLSSYRPILPAVDPELVLLARDAEGALRGFLFAVPDLAEGAAPTTVVLKTYASLGRGAGAVLADTLYLKARAKGYQRIIHALMHERNLSARHSERGGGRVFRRYALWGRRL